MTLAEQVKRARSAFEAVVSHQAILQSNRPEFRFGDGQGGTFGFAGAVLGNKYGFNANPITASRAHLTNELPSLEFSMATIGQSSRPEFRFGDGQNGAFGAFGFAGGVFGDKDGFSTLPLTTSRGHLNDESTVLEVSMAISAITNRQDFRFGDGQGGAIGFAGGVLGNKDGFSDRALTTIRGHPDDQSTTLETVLVAYAHTDQPGFVFGAFSIGPIGPTPTGGVMGDKTGISNRSQLDVETTESMGLEADLTVNAITDRQEFRFGDDQEGAFGMAGGVLGDKESFSRYFLDPTRGNVNQETMRLVAALFAEASTDREDFRFGDGQGGSFGAGSLGGVLGDRTDTRTHPATITRAHLSNEIPLLVAAMTAIGKTNHPALRFGASSAGPVGPAAIGGIFGDRVD